MDKYILSLDQGTTSSRCIIYDHNSKVISVAQREFKQYFPKEGWVEHDAVEIWSTQMSVAQETMLQVGLTYESIAAIGITNQRETTVVWDKKTGKPIYNAIVWQCRRTAEYCEKLKKEGYGDLIREKTGLLIDSYFSGSKVRWILENVDGALKRAEAGDLLFGTIETWLIWKMTGGKVHVTDYSNASRTMMFNIKELKWDDEILDILNVPKAMLPKPVECSMVYGETMPTLFGGSIPIAGSAGDQQAALFGETCFNKGSVKSTYGTGNFLLLNTGEEVIYSNNGLLTTVAWGLNGKVCYALEGSVFICGAVIKWLRDELELIKNAAESEDLAFKVKDTAGIYFVPAFVGLGAPYWEPYARGSIFGLTRGANKNHIVRAALESIAYQSDDLIKAMEADLGRELDELRVDGGACNNNFLMQFQADISDMKVIRPKNIESTSLGAAYLAGLAVGYFSDLEEIRLSAETDVEFVPKMNNEYRDELIEGWKRAVKATVSY
jgi:glycerol kinase